MLIVNQTCRPSVFPAAASGGSGYDRRKAINFSSHSHSHSHFFCRPSYPGLAAELVSEVAQCARFRESKTYLAALLKVLLTLPLTSQHSTAIKHLIRALVGRCPDPGLIRTLVGRCPEPGLASEPPLQEAPVLIVKGHGRFSSYMFFCTCLQIVYIVCLFFSV